VCVDGEHLGMKTTPLQACIHICIATKQMVGCAGSYGVKGELIAGLM